MTQVADTDASEIEQERLDKKLNSLEMYGLDDYDQLYKFLEKLSAITIIAGVKNNAEYLLHLSTVLNDPEYYAFAFKAHENLYNLMKSVQNQAKSICSSKYAIAKIAEAANVGR